jgi:hypothetical protein
MAKYSFSIGLNYQGTSSELPDCELDAQNITNALRPFSSKIWTFTNPAALDLEVGKYTHLTSKDILVFYYSGHGTLLPGGRGALCLYDSKMYYYPTSQLIAKLAMLPCTVVLILDCCYAGAGLPRTALPPTFREKSITYNPEVEIYESKLPRNVYVSQSPMLSIAACEDDQLSYSTGVGGAFTLSFLESRYNRLIFGRYVVKTSRIVTKGARTLTKLARRMLTAQTPVMSGTSMDIKIFP